MRKQRETAWSVNLCGVPPSLNAMASSTGQHEVENNIEEYMDSIENVTSVEQRMGEKDINPSATRSVYLVTYSQADMDKMPNRTDFAKAVVESITQGSCKVIQWCCSLEDHTSGGMHYHMALKLNKVQRWLGSKRYLSETYDITLHYSNVHHNYFSDWQYVTKSGTDYEESEGHPDLRNGYRPRTNNASVSKRNIGCKRKASNKSSNKRKKQSKSGKKKRLTALQVSDVILKKKIQNVTELHALAQERRDNGKTDLVEFILNGHQKPLQTYLTRL